MKFIAVCVLVAVAAAMGFSAGKSGSSGDSVKTSNATCIVAIRLAADEICSNPKAVCSQYKKSSK